MSKITILLFSLFLIGCNLVMQNPSLTAKTTARLNFRRGPSLQSPVMTVLRRGQELPLLEHLPGWYRTKYKGTEGFVSDRYIRLVKEQVRLKPAHAHILESAGWLDYVINHIDILKYQECSYLIVNDDPAAAFATIIDGKRWVEVATDGYTHLQIARYLVHEAAHLEIWTQTGELGSEGYSQSKERDLLRDYRLYLVRAGRLQEVRRLDTHLLSLNTKQERKPRRLTEKMGGKSATRVSKNKPTNSKG